MITNLEERNNYMKQAFYMYCKSEDNAYVTKMIEEGCPYSEKYISAFPGMYNREFANKEEKELF